MVTEGLSALCYVFEQYFVDDCMAGLYPQPMILGLYDIMDCAQVFHCFIIFLLLWSDYILGQD